MGRPLKQGDVHWVVFPDEAGRRPAVILTRTSATGYLRSVTVAPISTTIRGAPSEVMLSEADGMSQRCVASLDNIQTIRQSIVGPRIAHLSPSRLREVRAAIEFALGLDEMG